MSAKAEKKDWQSEFPGRRCMVCGRIGGSGATMPLRFAGYTIPKGQIGYAHAPCLIRKRKQKALR